MVAAAPNFTAAGGVQLKGIPAGRSAGTYTSIAFTNRLNR